VLLSIVGTIGRSWVVTDEFSGCNIARALARISVDESLMLPEFLQWVLSSHDVQETLNKAAFESARKTLNLSVLAELKLPQVSIDEQLSHLAERRRLSVAADALRAEMQAAGDLRAALLVEIFGGN